MKEHPELSDKEYRSVLSEDLADGQPHPYPLHTVNVMRNSIADHLTHYKLLTQG